MSTLLREALVQPVRNPFLTDSERRNEERHLCSLEATSQAVEPGQALSWGAVVENISVGGLSVALCYPFRPGTFLSIDLKTQNGMVRTVLVRVVHVHDRTDGLWRLGCEFLKPLTESELDLIV